ncbi:MAG: DUF4375 domain-containing protein [Deferribacteraceae bacterium]|jgi:tetratricopeptide (TPR) repeat protein|nr:DUF4375 domain-containing protein [Deferribacteraceae bacterium]
MDKESLLAKLVELHDADQHEEALELIEKTPESERDYLIASYYARALNNLDRYEEALQILMRLESEGANDPFWHFRVGYSLYYLEREAEAAGYFKRALELGDYYESTPILLKRSLIEALYKESFAVILEKLKEDDARELFSSDWDFLFIFLNKYSAILKITPDDEKQFALSDAQHTLCAYHFFHREVTNGGFIQLIHNGFGPYIFESPFVENIRLWGAERTADIIDKAELVYNIHKDKIEKEMTDKEFSELYSKLTDFEKLEKKLYKIMDEETKIIRDYIEEHLDEFVISTNDASADE